MGRRAYTLLRARILAMCMEQTVLHTIARNGLLAPGDYVIVALSGGADSIALFHLLHAKREELDIQLAAAHFEHGLRGEASRRDADFVRELCAERDVPLFEGRGEMANTPRPQGEGVEAWARRLRYAFFERLADEHGGKIATAHTQSDNAETVLFHAIRGSGPRGLSGIAPRRGPFIRPLLEVPRAWVEAYCARQGLAYVNDETNADVSFTRNRLRHEVMPLLERAHPGAAACLARMADDMRALDGYLAAEGEGLLRTAKVDGRNNGAPDSTPSWQADPALQLDAAILAKAPAPLRLQALGMLAGPAADRAALARLEEVALGVAPATTLPGGRVVRNKGGILQLDPNTPNARQDSRGQCDIQEVFGYQLSLDEALKQGELTLPGGYSLQVSLCGPSVQSQCPAAAVEENFPQKSLTFWADYDKILCGVFRTRRQSDRFSFPTRRVTKTLKKWMNEQKMPQDRRQGLPLLAGAVPGQVLWLWGEGFASGLQLGADTRRILQICQKER